MGFIAGFEREIAAAVTTAEGRILFEAVRAAGRMEVSEAAPRIRTLAASRDTDVDLRVEAILALPHVDPDCFEMLGDLTRSRNRDIAEAAEEAIEEQSMFADTGEDDFDEEE
jgi:hypothetical protein